jgi:hypothetical protein
MKVNYNNQEVDVFIALSPVDENGTVISLRYGKRTINDNQITSDETVGSKVIVPTNSDSRDLQLIEEIRTVIQNYINDKG